MSDRELVKQIVHFFQLAFEWLPEETYKQAWFGIHGGVISLTVGNLWLATVEASNGGKLLLANDQLNRCSFVFASTRKYVPVGMVIMPFGGIAVLNASTELWQNYARSASEMLVSPMSQTIIWRNVRRKRQLPDLLRGAVDVELQLPTLPAW